MTRLVSGSPQGSPDPHYRLAPERKRRSRTWLKLLVLLLILSAVLTLPWGNNAQTTEYAVAPVVRIEGPVRMAQIESDGFTRIAFDAPTMPEQALGTQSYLDGLTVEEGMTLTGDVTVWSGDADVEEGGRIAGSLISYAGDVSVEEGGSVEGDVTAWSGDVEISGRVAGNVSALAGDLEIEESAWVGGDVSTLGGQIRKSESAVVGGTVLRGGSINLPFANGVGNAAVPPIAPVAPVAPENAEAPEAPAAPSAPQESGRNGFNPVGSFFSLIGRLFVAIFFTVIGLLMAMAV
ncbi:MAG: bactofilin family protein [Caldilineaceae bacterium]